MDKTTKNEPPKIRKLHQKLAEFAGYTTLHGVNRMASNKRVIGKVLWCVVVLVCLGFCTRQIYLLCDQYARKPVIAMISIRQQTVRFPELSFCNLNPVSSYRISEDLNKDVVLWVMQSVLLEGIDEAEQIIHSTLHKSEGSNTTIGFSKVFEQIAKSNRNVRRSMSLINWFTLNVTLQAIRDVNPDIDDFIISCIFEGKPCKSSSFVPFFDKHYGLCYRFSTESNISKTSGPLFGFELVIDVNQSDYLPNIVTDAGIRLSIHKSGRKPFLQNNGMSVATGLQTDISLFQKTVERFPDSTLCDQSTTFNSILECFEHCRLENVERRCNCSLGLEEDHISLEGERACRFGWVKGIGEHPCIQEASANLTNCNCLSPCRETKYEKTVTTSRWPARNFEPILEKLYQKRGLNYSNYRDSLLSVNIYLESLSEEVITEELAFTVENLMSNIGGSLGLWIGMSIISIGEILELTWMLCSTLLKRRQISTTVPQSNDTTVAQSDTTTVEEPDTTTVEQQDNTAVV